MANENRKLADTTCADNRIQKLEEHLKSLRERCKDAQNHDWSSSILENISIVSHSSSPPHPSATFRLTVQPMHANFLGNLHGGCASTIFDICTTLSLNLISRPGFWDYGGVSRTLNVTYLRPVPVGTAVDIECEVIHAGQRLSSLRGVMRITTSDGTKGSILTTCEHAKFNTDPPVQKL
ncbi:Thioesterase/thiol ester dehydrase-isomerase [Nemania sp. FL0031]|nr:Thioesterase/thiol ester dehydrase-isomerase [Nemania sp. FL0031]